MATLASGNANSKRAPTKVSKFEDQLPGQVDRCSKPGPAMAPNDQDEKGEKMKQEKTQDTRVLGRLGARELTPRELDHVTGGLLTLTVQTFNPVTKQSDGDHSFGA